MGVSPPPLWLPRCDNPEQVLRHHRFSAGAVWGDRHCPLLHRTSILNFILKEKEFSRAVFLSFF